MKKLSLIVAICVAMFSCTSEPENTYVINGTISGIDQPVGKIFLFENKVIVDSAEIIDNKFTFKGVSDSARMFSCLAPEVRLGTNIFIDKGSELNVILDRVKGVDVKENGHINTAYQTFQYRVFSVSDSLQKAFLELKQNNATSAELEKSTAEAADLMKKLHFDFISDNADNLAGAYVAVQICRSLTTLEEYDGCVNPLKYKNRFPVLTTSRVYLNNQINTSTGKMFKDFKAKDVNGKDVSLSDYVGKGKYVLVDFWASWCGPCRGEIPNLKAAQKHFGGKNFTVLGVDIMDEDKQFKQALKEEKMNYPQITVGLSNEAIKLYGFTRIPQIILFGPDGTIIQRNLRGESVHWVLEKELAK